MGGLAGGATSSPVVVDVDDAVLECEIARCYYSAHKIEFMMLNAASRGRSGRASANFNYHYYLKDALRSRRPFERIWAKNRRRSDGSVSFKYVCATKRQFYDIVMAKCPKDEWWWYEIIDADSPASLYFDFEIEKFTVDPDVDSDQIVHYRTRLDYLEVPVDIAESVVGRYISLSGRDWEEEECRFVCGVVRYALETFLDIQRLPRDIICLNSSRGSKMSLHLLCRTVIFDRNYLSMRYFSWKFCRYLWTCVNDCFLHHLSAVGWERVPQGLIRLLMLNSQCDERGWFGLNDTGVDEAVYTPGRAFRLVGSSKMGSAVPLNVVPDDLSGYSFLTRGKRDMSCLEKTLIQRGEDTSMVPLVYRCSEECPYLPYYLKNFEKVHRTTVDRFYFNTMRHPYFEERDGDRLLGKRKAVAGAHRKRARKRHCCDRVYGDVFGEDQGYSGRSYEDQVAPSGVYDDDKWLYGPDFRKRQLKDFEVGDSLFHDCKAECKEKYNPHESPSFPVGVPSAFILGGDREGSKLLKCHACGGRYFILDTHHSPRYAFPRVVEGKYPEKMPDLVPLMMWGRLVVLDANCGSGKTFQIARCLKAWRVSSGLDDLGQPDLKIASFAYRKGLSLTLSDALNLISYTDINDRQPGDLVKWRHVSCCPGSLIDFI